APSSRSTRGRASRQVASSATSPATTHAEGRVAAISSRRALAAAASTSTTRSPRFASVRATSDPSAPPAPVTSATSVMALGLARARASGGFFAHLLEEQAKLAARSLLDLPHALLADAKLHAQLLQGTGLVGHEPLAHDELLALGEVAEGLVDGVAGAAAALAAAGVVFGGGGDAGQAVDHGAVLVGPRVEARLAAGEERQEELGLLLRHAAHGG